MSEPMADEPTAGATSASMSSAPPPRFALCLYVAGGTALSARAIVNVRRFCEGELRGAYDLEIVDICLHPSRAVDAQIIAAPTLIRLHPLPLRRFIGDMSSTDRILHGLALSLTSDTAETG